MSASLKLTDELVLVINDGITLGALRHFYQCCIDRGMTTDTIVEVTAASHTHEEGCARIPNPDIAVIMTARAVENTMLSHAKGSEDGQAF